MTSTDDPLRKMLLDQFDMSWALTDYHFTGLDTAACLWEPTSPSIHVRPGGDGGWRADWPETEGYEIGAPSIAWTTWHICFWWTKALDHIEGQGEISQADIRWPGTAEQVIATIRGLHDRWRALIETGDLTQAHADSWPIPDATLGAIAAWLNIELMKNAAEIGSTRFHYATRAGG